MLWWIWIIIIIIVAFLIMNYVIMPFTTNQTWTTKIERDKLQSETEQGKWRKRILKRSEGGNELMFRYANRTRQGLPLKWENVSRVSGRCMINYIHTVTIGPGKHYDLVGQRRCDITVWSHPNLNPDI